MRERVFEPLGLHETLFRPAQDAPRLLARIAPTEVNDWTGLPLRGVVHDPLAAALDGVAGNSGLFSSARDLAVIAQKLLDGAHNRKTAIAKPATIMQFTKRRSNDRGLGWDLATGADSPAGQFVSASTWSHRFHRHEPLGRSGARHVRSVAHEPDQSSASGTGHVVLRRAVHDAAALSITDKAPERRPTPSASMKQLKKEKRDCGTTPQSRFLFG